MWKNTYKDYKPDEPWIKESVEAGRGIIGCEMRERNGWGHLYQKPRTKKKSLVLSLMKILKTRVLGYFSSYLG